MTVSKKWVGGVAAVQGLMLLAWLDGGPSATPARADGIPDAGAQRDAMIEQLKATNAKLDRLVAVLTGGDLEVKVRKAEEPTKSH